MIGKVIIGKSFRGCIGYCLDKKEAEILDYNLCGGNKKELIEQFNEVRKLNQNVSKAVQHIIISLAKGEQLSKAELTTIAADCAMEMGFSKNQYIAVLHNDTKHQHFHIVVNRVGFEGKTVKDNHNYRKIAEFCRKMELKYSLQQVLSPRRYQSKAERQLPRNDRRKEKLKQDIKECLIKVKKYEEFSQQMKQRGYKIEKARGIAFIDEKKVRIKGSEVGYSLSTIEKILSQKMMLQSKQEVLVSKEKQIEKEKSLEKATNLLLKPEKNVAENSLLIKKRKRKRGFHL